MKKTLYIIITVAVGILLLLYIADVFGQTAKAQSKITGVSATHSATTGGYYLDLRLFFPTESVNNLLKSGKSVTVSTIKSSTLQAAVDAARRLDEMAESQNKSNWMPYVTPSAWEAAYQEYLEAIRIRDSIANANEDIGMAGDSDIVGGRLSTISNMIPPYVGKSYTPTFNQVWNAAYEVAATPFRAEHAALPTPTWEDAWPYIAVIGGIVVLLVLFG